DTTAVVIVIHAVFDVETGAEVVAAGSDQQHPKSRISAKRLDRGAQRVFYLTIECVELVGSIQREGEDSVVASQRHAGAIHAPSVISIARYSPTGYGPPSHRAPGSDPVTEWCRRATRTPW